MRLPDVTSVFLGPGRERVPVGFVHTVSLLLDLDRLVPVPHLVADLHTVRYVVDVFLIPDFVVPETCAAEYGEALLEITPRHVARGE